AYLPLLYVPPSAPAPVAAPHPVPRPPAPAAHPPPPASPAPSLHAALPIFVAPVVCPSASVGPATVSVALCAITIPSFTHRYTYVPTGTSPIPPSRNVTVRLVTLVTWTLNVSVPVTHCQTT